MDLTPQCLRSFRYSSIHSKGGDARRWRLALLLELRTCRMLKLTLRRHESFSIIAATD